MEEREIKLSMTIEEINILIDLVNAAHRESFEKQVNLKYSSDNDGRDKELRRFMMFGDILSKLEMEKYKMEK